MTSWLLPTSIAWHVWAHRSRADETARELKAGDLVFFGEHDEPQSAGIWLGEGRFAAVDPQTDRVAVLKLSDLRQNAKKTKTLGAFLWGRSLKASGASESLSAFLPFASFFRRRPLN